MWSRRPQQEVWIVLQEKWEAMEILSRRMITDVILKDHSVLVWTAITKQRRCNQQKFVCHSSGSWKVKTKEPADPVSREDPLPGL